MLTCCGLSAYLGRDIDGVYSPATDVRGQIEIVNGKFRFLERNWGLTTWWGDFAEASYDWVNDDFIVLHSKQPKTIADESIETVCWRDSLQANFTVLNLKIPAGSSRPLDVTIYYWVNDSWNWKTLRTAYYNTRGEKSVLLPDSILKISLFVKPQNIDPISMDNDTGLYFSSIYYSSREIEIEDGANNVTVEIPAINAGFFGRYHVDGEYVQVKDDALIWRGHTYRKCNTKWCRQYIKSLQPQP